MFGLFKKSAPEIPYRDKVWKTRAQAMKGLTTMALMRVQQGKSSVLLGQFPADLDDFKAFWNEHQVPYTLLEADNAPLKTLPLNGLNPSPFSEREGHKAFLEAPTIFLGETSAIDSGWFRQNVTTLGVSEIIFIGHCPMPSREQKYLAALQAMGINSFVFGMGLNDPLLAVFLSANIQPLLEKIGMEDEEALEHAYITTSIKRAFEKLSSKVKVEKSAKSAAEWLALNVN